MLNSTAHVVVKVRVKEDILGTIIPSEFDLQFHDKESLEETLTLFKKDEVVLFILDKDSEEMYAYTSGKHPYVLEDINISGGKFNDEYADENFEFIEEMSNDDMNSIDPAVLKELDELYNSIWTFQIDK